MEVLNMFKKENDRLYTLLGTLGKRLDDLELCNRNLEIRCQQLELRSKACEKRLIEIKETSQEDLMQEVVERQRRQKFLIVSGLPEHRDGRSANDGKLEDAQHLTVLASLAGLENFKPVEVHRIGRISHSRPRLLRFKCKSVDDKIMLLRSSKNLRKHTSYGGVYINPDLTRNQREANKVLRAELQRRRQDGELVIIHRGRIVKKSELKENFQ